VFLGRHLAELGPVSVRERANCDKRVEQPGIPEAREVILDLGQLERELALVPEICVPAVGEDRLPAFRVRAFLLRRLISG
jgi:hypothetical protein